MYVESNVFFGMWRVVYTEEKYDRISNNSRDRWKQEPQLEIQPMSINCLTGQISNIWPSWMRMHVHKTSSQGSHGSGPLQCLST